MLALIDKGLDRETAYSIVQRSAMKSWEKRVDFRKLLLKDKEARKYLTPKGIEEIFNLRYYLKHLDYIFKRVFGSSKVKKG